MHACVGREYFAKVTHIAFLRDDCAYVDHLRNQGCESESGTCEGFVSYEREPLRRRGRGHIDGPVKTEALGLSENFDNLISDDLRLGGRTAYYHARPPAGVNADSYGAPHTSTVTETTRVGLVGGDRVL
jgi:hypothetical protein